MSTSSEREAAAEDKMEMTLNELSRKLDEVEEHVRPLLQKSLPEVFHRLSPIEVAKLEISLAFALDSLMFINAKLEGIPVQDHAVMKELQRVKLWIKKVKQVEKGQDATCNIFVNSSDCQCGCECSQQVYSKCFVGK